MTKKEISLWNDIGVGLIIKESSSVTYTNQVGGTSCLQLGAEGYLVPVNNDCAAGDYQSSLEYKLSNFFESKNTLSETDADLLDELLSRYEESKFICCDRKKLHESNESWVFVNIDYKKCESLRGFTSTSGVLTWPNSD